jgi:hypothetical protein
LKRFWAKIRKKDRTVRKLLRWKGIFVNSGKLGGFSTKLPGPAGFDLIDPVDLI